MQILLTGSTGHLGRHVLKQLGATRHAVRCAVRTQAAAGQLLGFAQEIAVADLTDRASLAGLCDGIDTVISTVGASVHINVRGRQSFREIDYQGNRNLLEAAQRAKVRKFVYVSVVTTPALARTAYVRAKEDFASLVMASGLEYQILRPTGFFTAFADLVGMARRGSLPLVAGGEAKTNPIDDEEVARACIEAVESSERERAIGGPDILTRKQILDLVFQAIGRPGRYKPVPAALVKIAGAAYGIFNPRLGDLTQFFLAVSQNDVIAPAYGVRRLEDYLKRIALYS